MNFETTINFKTKVAEKQMKAFFVRIEFDLNEFIKKFNFQLLFVIKQNLFLGFVFISGFKSKDCYLQTID